MISSTKVYLKQPYNYHPLALTHSTTRRRHEAGKEKKAGGEGKEEERKHHMITSSHTSTSEEAKGSKEARREGTLLTHTRTLLCCVLIGSAVSYLVVLCLACLVGSDVAGIHDGIHYSPPLSFHRVSMYCSMWWVWGGCVLYFRILVCMVCLYGMCGLCEYVLGAAHIICLDHVLS